MKKKIILFITFLFVGCHSYMQFHITQSQKIMVTSGNTGESVEIKDISLIEDITNQFNSLRFEKQQSSENYTGWDYQISWYDNDNHIVEEITILDQDTINYNHDFYVVIEGSIDVELLKHRIDQ